MIAFLVLSLIFSPVGQDSPDFQFVKEAFEKTIMPLYGDQTRALKQIGLAKDRVAEILKDRNESVGLIVYKLEPTDEFAVFGIERALELKTLLVTQEKGRGYGKILCSRIEEIARKNGLFNGIAVTVASDKIEPLIFFQRRGFVAVKGFKDKYRKGSYEFLLYKRLK